MIRMNENIKRNITSTELHETGQEFRTTHLADNALTEDVIKKIEDGSYLIESWKQKMIEFNAQNVSPNIGLKLIKLFRPLKKYSLLIHSVMLLLSTTDQAKDFDNQFYQKYSHDNKVIDFSRKFNQIMDLAAIADKKEGELLQIMKKVALDDDQINEDNAYLGA